MNEFKINGVNINAEAIRELNPDVTLEQAHKLNNTNGLDAVYFQSKGKNYVAYADGLNLSGLYKGIKKGNIIVNDKGNILGDFNGKKVPIFFVTDEVNTAKDGIKSTLLSGINAYKAARIQSQQLKQQAVVFEKQGNQKEVKWLKAESKAVLVKGVTTAIASTVFMPFSLPSGIIRGAIHWQDYSTFDKVAKPLQEHQPTTTLEKFAAKVSETFQPVKQTFGKIGKAFATTIMKHPVASTLVIMGTGFIPFFTPLGFAGALALSTATGVVYQEALTYGLHLKNKEKNKI